MRYLSACRSGIIADLGGIEALSTQKIILVDRLISLLGVVRGIEEYHREDIFTKTGELVPALQCHYLAYCNSVRLLLGALGLEKRPEEQPTIQQVIADINAKAKQDEQTTQEDAEQLS